MAHSVYKYRKGEAYPHCYKYPQVAVTADCIVFSYDCRKLKVLLIKRKYEPFKGQWAFPGGFINPDETVEQGAVRELMEETSMKVEYMRQIKVFSTPGRDPRQRTMTVPFIATAKPQGAVVHAEAGDDASEAVWFPADELPELAFDHKQIMEEALGALRLSFEQDFLARYLMPERFTLPQLQRLYEQVLGTHFDRRNFARKMMSLNLLEFSGTETSLKSEQCGCCTARDKGLPSRVASVYKFR